MSVKSSDNLNSYKTGAILFSISGIIFIVLSIVDEIFFLPIGIALMITSISFWQRSKYLAKDGHKDTNNPTKG